MFACNNSACNGTMLPDTEQLKNYIIEMGMKQYKSHFFFFVTVHKSGQSIYRTNGKKQKKLILTKVLFRDYAAFKKLK